MKFESIIKKINRRLPDTVIHPGDTHNRKYWFQYNEYVVSFYKDEIWDKPGEFCGTGFHMRRVNDVSDPMTDYFAGSFYDNITQILNVLSPPPSKYNEGDLVMTKNTKRMQRYDLANLIGIITKVRNNGYPSYVLMVGGKADAPYETSYIGERDIKPATA